MHQVLEKLLQDIVDAADEEERYINDLMIEFPMPPQNFLEGLSDREAWVALCNLATALSFSYYNNCKMHVCWISKSATCIENYKTICEYWSFSSSRYEDLERHYGDTDLAFKLAKTGAEGGIHGIIRTIVQNMKNVHIQSRVDSLIPKVWNVWEGERKEFIYEKDNPTKVKKEVTHKIPLHGTYDEHEVHVQSYKDRFRALLPSEYLEEDIFLSVYRFDKILAKHHLLVRGFNTLMA